MNESSLVDYLLVGILFFFIVGLTVWFGGWMHKNKDEALDLQDNDEHENFLEL